MTAATESKRLSQPDAQLRELIDRARQGDKTAVAELKKALDENPGLWQAVGNLARHVENVWLGLIAQRDLFLYECLRRQVRRIRRRMLRDCTTEIERQLVEKIVLCFVQSQHSQLLLAATENGSSSRRSYYAKRADACERRYLAAVSQWTKARELLGGDRRTSPGAENRAARHEAGSRSKKASGGGKTKPFSVVSA